MEPVIVTGKLRQQEAGFGYLAVLVIVFIMGLSLTIVSENISTSAKRQK